MARKSRKQDNNIKSVSIKSLSIPVAGYVRLSVKDLKNEGDSIETQKKIIINYINNHLELQLFDFYIDEGISGTTFDRPSFTKMLEDAANGKIRCIVVKDVTRFGRDMLQTGYYITKYFPSASIRFISINDDFDTSRDDASLFFTLKNMFSEYYAIDIGNKVRSVLKHQMEDGKFVGSRPPFGYTKASNDCHQLVIDEPAAIVVKKIFGWAENGKNVSKIVRSLNSLKIITPSHYWFQTGIIKNADMTGDGRWHARTVSKILSNDVYTGKLAQGKTKIANTGQQAASPEKLIEVDNTHEPIVSPELFRKVQEILNSRGSDRNTGDKSFCTPYSPNLFVGKAFCAHCGVSMNRKRTREMYFYRCTTKYSAPGRCIGNSIKEDALINEITEQFIGYIEALPENNFPDIELIRHELEMLQVELSYKDDVVPGLFESLHNGDISEDEFRELKSIQQQKFEQLEKRREQSTLQYKEQKAVQEDWCELKSALLEFNQTGELTQELVDTLLLRIEVHKDGKVQVEFKRDIYNPVSYYVGG